MTSRRAPDGPQRRRDLCDVAIRLLAEQGPKGLSHPRVDREAGVPDGSTSYYFRTRKALLLAVAERVAELDLADLRSVIDADDTDQSPVSTLAAVVMKSLSGDGLTRTRARIELLLQASRDQAISDAFHANSQTYLRLHRELAEHVLSADADAAKVDDRALLTVTFISGLMLGAASEVQPAQPRISRDRVEALLSQIVGADSSPIRPPYGEV